MPAIGLVDVRRVVDEIFEGEAKGDEPEHVQGGRHPARRGREALEGMAHHAAEGGRGHGSVRGGHQAWDIQRRGSGEGFYLGTLYWGFSLMYINGKQGTSPVSCL